MSTKADSTGRGAWTRIGMGSLVTDYQVATPYVGQGYISAPSLGFNFHAVNSGVKAIQTACLTLVPDLVVDGVYGPLTFDAVKKLQKSLDVTVDGQFGPISAKATFSSSALGAEVLQNIPNHYLAGLLDLESSWDPGAVGAITTYGIDRGLAQINDQAHPSITWDQAYTVSYAIPWAAEVLAEQFVALNKNWDAAIAYWNNPGDALFWSKRGFAPNAQIAQYVALVKERAETY